MNNEHTPAESILIHQPLGLTDLGAVFNADAPFSACRLCGRIYQSKADREAWRYLQEGFVTEVFNPITGNSMFIGDSHACSVIDESDDRRKRWREAHEKRHHTADEIEALKATGMAFTPEAAYVLSSYGIFPTGNMHPEVVDAMATAPRAPIDDVEGG